MYILKRKINKLYIHFISTKRKNNVKQLRKTFHNCIRFNPYLFIRLFGPPFYKKHFIQLDFVLFSTYILLIFRTREFKNYLFNFNYYIKHNDYALIRRELLVLILIWAKWILFCNLIDFSLQKKKISILRSPFVYSNAKEQFEIYNFRIWINFLGFTNILFYNYFSLLNTYFNKYSLLKVTKYLK